jgi:hypothetical protein
MSFDYQDEQTAENISLAYRSHIVNKISDNTIKVKLTAYVLKSHILKMGAEYTHYGFENSASFLLQSDIQKAIQPCMISIFTEDKWSFGSLISKIGYRGSYFSPRRKWNLEPRISFAWNLPANYSLKAAWGVYYQYIANMNTQEYELSQFLDYYYPLMNQKPMKSMHYIIGFEGKIASTVHSSVSLYFKNLTQLYMFNYSTSLRDIFNYESFLERGKGSAYGLELLLKGKLGNFSGWISYTLSRSLRSFDFIHSGKTFLFDGDKTHSFKSVLNFKLTEIVSLSSVFEFSSGVPRTFATGMMNYFSYDPLTNKYGIYPIEITPEKNNVRFPAFISWDLGMKKLLRKGFGILLAEFLGSNEAYLTWTFYNVLFLHRNPYIYFVIDPKSDKLYGLDPFFIPSISVGYFIKF